MGFWSRLIGRSEAKAAVAEPINAVQIPSAYSMLFQTAEMTPYQCWNFYKSVAPFAKVVDLIADGVANLKPVVYVDGEPVTNHPVANFLNRPGFNRNRKRFIKELTVQELVSGTGYIQAYGNTEYAPAALDVLKSQFVSHFVGGDMWPLDYLYAEGTRSSRFRRDDNPRDFKWVDEYGMSEIIPIYDMDGDRRGVGMPRLLAIRNDVELRLKGIVHNNAMIDNGARLSGVLSYDAELTSDQEQSIQAQFEQRASGAHNAGRVLISAGGKANFTSLQQSLRDMDFAKLIEMVEDAIASRYNVPVTLFRTQAQTNNNYETAWNVLYDQAILPTYETVMSGVSAMFSRRFGQQIDIRHDALTTPILAKQAVARSGELYTKKLITKNEARAEIGYEPVLGGDFFYEPMGMVPQGEDIFTGIDDALGEGERPSPRMINTTAPAPDADKEKDKGKKVDNTFRDLKSAMQFLSQMQTPASLH